MTDSKRADGSIFAPGAYEPSSPTETKAVDVKLQKTIRGGYKNIGIHEKPICVSLRRLLRGNGFMCIGMICLFLALYIPDLMVIADASSDGAGDIILLIVFVVFLLEWLLLSVVDPR